MSTAITRSQLISCIENMTMLEVSELIKELEEKFGVTASAPMPMMIGPPGAAAPVEEKTEFDVILETAGDKKLEVIKIVREISGLGLKEAKELVEGAPKPLKTGLNKAEADSLKKKLTEVGATVTIK